MDRRRVLVMGGAGLAVAVLAGLVLWKLTGDEPRRAAVGPGSRSCKAAAQIGPSELKGPGSWADLVLPPERECFTLTATKKDAAGVAPDTHFVLAGREPLDAGAARRRLTVDPPVPLKVTGDGKGLRVEPEQRLAEDTVYRFSLLESPGGGAVQRWSFQSRGRLRVVQTLPADQATGVPTNIGIELTFSHDGVTGVQERLKIDPPVEGRFETHRRSVVFVPKGLRPATLYTVTLSAGARLADSAEAMSSDFAYRFETGSTKRDGQSPAPPLSFGQELWESPVSEAPVLGLFEAPDARGGSIRLAVHRFPRQEDFLASLDAFARIPFWADHTRRSFTTPAKDLPEVATFEAPLERAGPSGERFVRFPQPLLAGYYLTRTELAGQPAQVWLQVTDLAAYASVSERKTLVWVNDVRSRQAVAGATVALAGAGAGPTATTGPDGVALFDTPESLLAVSPDPLGVRARRARDLVVTAPGGRVAVVPLAVTLSGASSFAFREYEFAGDPGRYWRFLYSDRTLYQPTDTVNVWGLVRPREGPPPAKEVAVEVTGNDEEGRPVRVLRASFPVSSSGTFIGKLELVGVSPGYYTLGARFGDQAVASTSFEVRDFAVPAYSIDVTPSRRAVFAGDDVVYAVRAAFAEGTPVPGARLRVDRDGEEKLEVTTDGQGRASVTMKSGTVEYGRFGVDIVSVTPAVPEEGEIAGGADVRVFPAAVLLETRADRRGGNGVVSGTAYGVDLALAGRDEAASPDDARGPPAAGRTVVAEVEETSYRAIETGDYYDFVAKVVRKSYRYEEQRSPAGRFEAKTDRAGRFEVSFPAAGDRSYRITLTTTDDAGRTYKEEQYLSSGVEYPNDFVQLWADDAGRSYPVGAEVALAMRRGAAEELPAGGDNRYLFLRAQNGIRSYAVQDGPRYAFSFGQADVPGVAVAGVRFTGSTYEEASEPYLVPFDPAALRLKVEVKAERDRYRPGEKARLDVRVTDVAGKPVEAEVLLSAVDERVFRLQGFAFFDRLDVLEELYLPVDAGLLGSYASHRRPVPTGGGGAEKGEGGEARSDFRLAALFHVVRTGSDGRGSATFALPDSLTSWRVSALGLSSDLRAGSGVALVPVGLPLFADVAMSESYLTGDRPVVRLRAFGEALSGGDQVTFTVESKTLFDAPLTASGAAFAAVDVALPPLREGRHDLTVQVAANDRSDALRRRLSVVRSRLLRAESQVTEVGAGEAWRPDPSPDGPVRLVLSDHNRGRWYPALQDLLYTPGDRVDQTLAREEAEELLSRYFDEGVPLPSTFRGSAYQTKDGGVAILPFADDDLAVTARVAALAPERFGRQGLSRYLRTVLDDPEETRERALVALYGLAAQGEPVLPELQRLSLGSDLSPRERLYAGLGAAALGDFDGARRLYRKLLEDFGQVRGETVRLDVAGDEDDLAEATSLAAILGAQLADRLAPALGAYVGANATKDVLVELERISFLAAVLPNLSAEPVRYAYTQSGKRVEDEVERGQAKVLALSTLADFDLRVEDGRLGVARSSLVPVDPKSVRPDRALSLQRQLPGTIGAGDLVRISLSYRLGPKAVDGCHRVTDLLPSGLRVLSQPYRFGLEDRNLTYPYAVEGQRVSFCAFEGTPTRPIVYYARVVSPGAYLAEPAVIQALRAPESIALTGATPVEIR